MAQLIEGVLHAMADGCRDAAAANGVPDPRTRDQLCADAMAATFEALGGGIDVPVVPDPRQYDRAEDGEQDDGWGSGTGTEPDEKKQHPNERQRSARDSEGRFGATNSPTASRSAAAHAGAGSAESASAAKTAESANTAEIGNIGGDSGAIGSPRAGLHSSVVGNAEGVATRSHQGDTARRELNEAMDAHEDARQSRMDEFGLAAMKPGQVLAWWRPSRPLKKGRGAQVIVTMTDATLQEEARSRDCLWATAR